MNSELGTYQRDNIPGLLENEAQDLRATQQSMLEELAVSGRAS